MEGIAVVGVDCLFPGVHGAPAYWDLLMRRGEVTGAVPEDRWRAEEFPSVSRGGFAADIDVFDHVFFAVPPREAAAMDPHQRMLLQCAWRAIEDSGTAPSALAGSETGVFVGVMGGEWGRLTMSDSRWVTPQLGAGSSAGMIANRVSYHLDLGGPSLAVDTACSSSLVAVHLAVNSLLSGECDTALAAGVNLVLSPALGLVYEQMGLAAPDGRCKPFSTDADGIGRGDGVAVVVLRRLADALADGSRVYAVIRGTAVNQDGRSNGVTAPSRWSQQKVLEAAYRRAGVTADQVRFVEAHGTGTVLGDAIECAALGSVHGVERDQPCAIGSVKGNLGHTEGAAGIVGLVKAALALHHRIVPASLFADRENPRLRLAERGLRLLRSPLRLPRGESFAGVSSFGMGGTNAHAVLASAPRTAVVRSQVGPAARTGSTAHAGSTASTAHAGSTASTGPAGGAPAAGVFTLTADSPAGLRRNLVAQAAALRARPRGPVAALCWSSARVKTGLSHRYAVTARDTRELAEVLERAAASGGEGVGRPRSWSAPTVAFLFTGQGGQYPGMTAGLYRESRAYRRHLDAADTALAPHTGHSVRELILTGDRRIGSTRHAQPALFAVGYALAATFAELGVRPAAVLGHGVGEYAAAVAAGVLGLGDAARLVAARGALMAELPPDDAMPAVSGAFHPAVPAPVLPHLRDAARGLRAERPQVPFASTRHGRMLREEPLDADYWVAQAAEPVRFGDALSALMRESGPTHLLELGPRPQLPPPAGMAGEAHGAEFLHPCPGPEATGRDLAEVVARLYTAGLDPDWAMLYAPEDRRVEPLAPYVFDPERRFREERPAAVAAVADRMPGPVDASAGAAPGADFVRALRVEADPVLAAVVAAVHEVGGYPEGTVGPATRFYEDLGFDSVMIMQLKDRIEARLPRPADVSVPEMLPALGSVAALTGFLTDHLAAAGTPAA
ncbi:type I polyketide synthase [Streptomyces sp. NPDC059072]|uniref:type I polyketide synthase n=1 Tax=Streptomyces sp. NPDC059072 TaxID=3346715 RepID=UPI003684C2FB